MQTTRRENSNLSWAALANLWADGAEALPRAIHLRWAQRINFCIQKYAMTSATLGMLPDKLIVR